MNAVDKARVKEIHSEIKKYDDIITIVNDLRIELGSINRSCKHEDAYIKGYYSDPVEGRSYDEILCPDCGEEWDERVGRNKIQSKKEYLSKLT